MMKDEQNLQLSNLIELLNRGLDQAIGELSSYCYENTKHCSEEHDECLRDKIDCFREALSLAKNIRDCPVSVKGDWQHK